MPIKSSVEKSGEYGCNDLLGPQHVLLGSDWPIMPIAARERVETPLTSLNLTATDQAAILSGNTTRLLRRV